MSEVMLSFFISFMRLSVVTLPYIGVGILCCSKRVEIIASDCVTIQMHL